MECLFRFQPLSAHYYPLPLKYKNQLIFTTQSDEQQSGIYSFSLETNKLSLLTKYPSFLSFIAHGSIIFDNDKIIVFGGQNHQSLLQYDIKKKQIDFALNNTRYCPLVLQPLLQITSYPIIFKLYDMCYLIQSFNKFLVVTQQKIFQYDWKFDYFPCFYYKNNTTKDDMYFFGAYNKEPNYHSIEQNMVKEKIFSGKFNINRPLTHYRCAYPLVTISWKRYFKNIVEFVPIYQILSPFNELIFILIYEVSLDAYYIDLNLNQKYKVNLAVPAEFTSNWSNDVFVSETNKNELNFISLKAGLFYRLDPLDSMPSDLFKFYHNVNCQQNMKLIQKYCEKIKQYTIPLVVKKLISLYYPLYIMKF